MEFNSLVQITHMYLRSNCSWNIISKRLSFINDLPNIVELQRLIMILNHSAIFWRLKNFIPWMILVDMCKKYEKICHVRSIFEWKMSHISWLCITIFLHVFFCCWNLESMSTSTFLLKIHVFCHKTIPFILYQFHW